MPRIAYTSLIAGLALTGCAGIFPEPTPPAEPSVAQPAVTIPDRFEARVRWTGASRGGAAIRSEGYEHVIARDLTSSVHRQTSDIAALSSETRIDLEAILSKVLTMDSPTASRDPLDLSPRQQTAPQR